MMAVESSLIRPRVTVNWWPLLAVLATATIFASPALWNGFPLVYYDSVDYVIMPFSWDMPIYRTGAYGVFALTGRLSHSLWGVVFAQCLLAAYVLHEAFDIFSPVAPRRALVTSALALALLTGLPWATSEILPDAFTGAVVLGTLALAFHDGRLALWREVALAAVLSVATAVHTSHFAILGGMMLCLLAARWLAQQGWPVLFPRFRAILIAFVAALGIAIGSNWLMTGRPFLAQPSAVLTLGLLVQDGLAKRYLDEVCKKPGTDKPRLCMARNRLPDNANEFLWHDDIFWKLGGWGGMQPEAERIVNGCLTKYPFTYAWTSIKLMFQQLAMLETGDGIAPMQFFIGNAIRDYYPSDTKAFENARQQSTIYFGAINAIQVPVQLVAFIALFPLLWLAWLRRDKVSATLAAFVLLALLGNAFVCGALSNPNDRYQSRIAWVSVLAVALVSTRLVMRKGEA